MRGHRLATGWKRVALLALTGLTLTLAIVGIVLPGLPTTPFVLLASYCLMQTSRRWHQRLLHSRLFGEILRDWYLHRGVSAHIRVKALTLLAIVVAASCLWPGTPLAAKGIVLVGAALGATYVLRLPVATR